MPLYIVFGIKNDCPATVKNDHFGVILGIFWIEWSRLIIPCQILFTSRGIYYFRITYRFLSPSHENVTSKMIKNGPKWSKMIKIMWKCDSKIYFWYKVIKIIGRLVFLIVFIGFYNLDLFEILSKNGSKWSKMIINDQKWSKIIQNNQNKWKVD